MLMTGAGCAGGLSRLREPPGSSKGSKARTFDHRMILRQESRIWDFSEGRNRFLPPRTRGGDVSVTSVVMA